MAALLLCPHLVEGERSRLIERKLSGVSYKDTRPVMRVPASEPYLNLIASKVPASKYYHIVG